MIFAFILALQIAQAEDPQLLLGRWEQDCYEHKQKTEVFYPEHVSFFENYYVDDRCNQALFTFKSTGAYSLPGPANVDLGTEKMDFRFEQVEVLLKRQDLVDQFNAEKTCGFSDWVINEAKDITALLCDFFSSAKPVHIPAAGEMRYGIYKMAGDELYLGRLTLNQNGRSEGTRPTDLDLSPYLKINP